MEEQSHTQNLQNVVGESNIHLKQANIKMLIITSICDEHDIVALSSNITVRCLTVAEFKPNSVDKKLVLW